MMRRVVMRTACALALTFCIGTVDGAVVAKKKPARKASTRTAASKKKTVLKKVGARKPAAKPAVNSKRGRTGRRRVVRRAPYVTAAVRTASVSEISTRLVALEQAFENPGALIPFLERLHRLQREPAGVHVLHYGDSHTASDDWASVMREGLQGRFGNGGAGFAMPGHPFRGYRRYDLQATSSKGWVTEGTTRNRGDGMHGLGGISLQANRAGETITLNGYGEEGELWFLRQPAGGSFAVEVNGVETGQISTEGELGPVSAKLEVAPGAQRIAIRTTSARPVRVLGVVLQQKAGVTWETMGINGAHASMIGEWAEPLLGAQMASRDPALIVIAYGTNEAHSPRFDPRTYLESLRAVIAELRRLAPAATLLMVGPPDCRVRSQAALTQLIELQRQVATETGAAFWDWRGRMGGPGSIRTWVSAGYAQGDYIHMTTAGYQLLGRTLLNDLLGVYDRFVQVRMEAANEQAR